jgi:aminomethyltransferase
MDIVLSTTGYSGVRSYEVFVIGVEPYPQGRELGNRLWRAIRDAGAPLGLREAPVENDHATEVGMVTIGHTEGDKINALEFWRPNVVDLSKGDFIGKRALMDLRAAGGPRRRMVGLVAIDSEARFVEGEWAMDLYQEDRIVGVTRRIAFSRHLDRAIAIGQVDRDAAAPGTRLMFPHAGGVDEVRLVDLPFVQPKRG